MPKPLPQHYFVKSKILTNDHFMPLRSALALHGGKKQISPSQWQKTKLCNPPFVLYRSDCFMSDRFISSALIEKKRNDSQFVI